MSFAFQLVQSSLSDAHWLVLEQQKSVGQYALWWHQTPDYGGQKVGLIGHYQVANQQVAQALLTQACRELAAQGCQRAIAPMDGNTWHSYRLITEHGKEPLFFLEPHFPGAEASQFLAIGFTPLAHYYSALNTDLAYQEPRVQKIWHRLENLGVRLRPLALSQLEADLTAIYHIATRSFRHHLLYQDLAEADFKAQYCSLLPHLRSELIWIAEHNQRAIGFAFALPDRLETLRGEPSLTVILKTLAVLPERRYAGLGQVLMEKIHAIAAELGYKRVIHALMQQNNPICVISRRYAQPMRRYSLFTKLL